MRSLKIGSLCVLSCLGYVSVANAFTFSPEDLYVTAGSGWADTSWSMLDAHGKKDGISNFIYSTNPQSASDKGADFNIGAGYNFSDHLAIEADYFHFANSNIAFDTDPETLAIAKAFYPNMPDSGKFSSKTYAFQLVSKFGIPFYHDRFKAYVDIGPGYVRRSDVLAKIGRIGGSFGGGLDYEFDKKWSMNTSFSYLTGYGKSVIDPADKYIPFIYTVNANIAYSF